MTILKSTSTPQPGTLQKTSLGTAIQFPRSKGKQVKSSARTTNLGEKTFATNNQPTPDKQDPRGSLWRRWDLHVHTPKSIVNNYPGGDTVEGWNAYLSDLETLPAYFKVIGINDYLFIDGYERVLEAKAQGRLSNIDLILPVIELRLDKFGGTDTDWNKVNYHVIFSNHVKPADIKTHFLARLEAKHSRWSGGIDQRTLAEFGQQIMNDTPPEKRGHLSAIEVGFNCLTFQLEDLQRLLQNTTAFKNNYLTAIGKAEWDKIRWDKAIADKRTIVDSAQFLFTASANPDAWRKAADKLREDGIDKPLLDCSDAHHASTSDQKDRVGHCYTWIKADTTFAGLQQALHNPQRIYIGDRPDKLRTVEQNPTKFLTSLHISKTTDATIDEEWFKNTIALNHDFVAIIGNKGMGKSALTDIIALTSNTDVSSKNFAFLDERHFRDNENKAHDFTATANWLAGPQRTRRLDENIPPSTVPLVRYIPQHYFEGLCNETANAGKLQVELQKVIFSHLDDTEKLGHTNLQALINDRTVTADQSIATFRAQLTTTNQALIDLERASTTTTIAKLEQTIALKQASLEAHIKSQPTAVPPPLAAANSTPALDEANDQRRQIESELLQIRETLRTARQQQAAANDLDAQLAQFRQAIARLKNETAPSLSTLGLAFEDIVSITIATETITERRTTLATQITTGQQAQDALAEQLRTTNERIRTITDELDEPNRLYQRYLADHETWERERDKIIGTANERDSIAALEAQVQYARNHVPEQIATLREDRAAISKAIHQQLLGKAAFQRQLYSRIQEELKNSVILASKLPIAFDARLVDNGFANTFNSFIHHGKTGKLMDEELIANLVKDTDMNDQESLARTLDRIINDLFDGSDVDNIERQLTKGGSIERLYQQLYGLEYLDARYSLRIKGRELTHLTPGERGSVLLVFYLLADKDTRPLIIDQPEENLDNQSLYELIAPCIAEAKKRRQIIMVTHNPNLAVVCDAEQIIWCFIDKEARNKVTYDTGSIENPRINKHVVNVLEGTWPAFRTREQMYQD